ncbi:hypothetical protein DM480_02965 [Sphingomonas sp. FARSPH]|jgi:hypothetical protein|nr:hypothetical protein DM480_02965 [Sphingomonas sp. FARSPH]
MVAALKLLVIAQTAFWAWASWKTFARVRAITAEASPSRPLSYVAGHWLLVALFAAFAVGSLLALLGFG